MVLGEFAEMMMFCHRNYGMIFGYNYKTCPNAWNQMVTLPWYCCDPSMQICQEKMFNFDNVFNTDQTSICASDITTTHVHMNSGHVLIFEMFECFNM